MRCGAWPEIARAAAANIVSYRTPFRRLNRFISNTLWLASMEAKQKRRTLPGPVTAAIITKAPILTTVSLLQMNAERRIERRAELVKRGLFQI